MCANVKHFGMGARAAQGHALGESICVISDEGLFSKLESYPPRV
jgi:hypothetical protein